MIPILCARMTPEIAADAKRMAMIRRARGLFRKCAKCGHSVLLSPSSLAMVESGICYIECHECNAQVPGVKFAIASAEQMEELERMVNQNVADN